ncbi:RNA polymerase subunit sigma [Candidatus Pacearchaeota archaeon]|nr:RNA polymerase subunit sigma [Candidatus Pacearchaeota archaeon]|tara:strand:+ start:375 stop:1136 length:762 start_codon:yes stop_codon:yes gene_type:complete
MSQSLDSYFKDVSNTKLLTREEEVILSQRIERGDATARNIMIESNLRLAISIAKKYYKSGCDMEDLIQESNIGLMKAVEKFDWRRGFKFSTYACWWIKQSVCRHISTNRNTVKVPAHTASLAYKVRTIIQEYEKDLGQKPSIPEISELLGVTENMVKASLESIKFQNMLSIDGTIGNEEGGRSIIEVIADSNNIDIDGILDKEKIMIMIKSCLSRLSQREEQILRLRFGISDNFEHTDAFDVTEDDIADIVKG